MERNATRHHCDRFARQYLPGCACDTHRVEYGTHRRGSVSLNNGAASVSGLPAGGTILVFNGTPVTISAGQSLLNLPFTLSQSSAEQIAGPATGAYAGTGVIGSTPPGGVTKPTTLYAFGPQNGQTIFSWLVQLPASPNLALSFSAGYWDGHTPASQGYMMSVRVNGTPLWQHNLNAGGGWNYGSVELQQWSGKTALIELITDTLGPNYNDFTSWAELAFGASGGGSNCSVSLSSYGPERSQYRIERDNLRRHGFGLRLDCAGQFALGHGVGFGPIGEWHRDLHDRAEPGGGAAIHAGGQQIRDRRLPSRLSPRCDVQQVGTTDVVDVQAIVNEALGITAAADDLTHDGRWT